MTKRTSLPSLPRTALVAFYVAIGLAPLALVWAQDLPARSVAMVGFAMLLAEFLLSGRFRQVSGKVGIGLTMRFHQVATLSFLDFVVTHPFPLRDLAQATGSPRR